MPTYMYKCRDCGHRFEEVQGFHDDPLQICPDCSGQVQRVIGNVGVTFKGSGFYRTDSRSAKKSSAGSAPKKSESTSDSSTTKTGTKDSSAAKDSSAPKSTGGSSTGS